MKADSLIIGPVPLSVPLTGASGIWASAAWNYFHQGGYINVRFDGLYHFRHRSYNPYIGQWLQRDPAGFVDGLNLHEYVGSNPVNHLDPTGQVIWFLPLIVAGIGVAGIEYYTAKGAYYGGAEGAGEVLGAAGKGAKGGVSIAANTYSFGLTDHLGWTASDQYKSPEFTASRILATISREALIAAVTMGTAQVSRGGIQGAGWVANLMRKASYSPTLLRVSRAASTSLTISDVAAGSYEVGYGLGIGLWEGDWIAGGLHILGGGLRVAGGFAGAREMSFWLAPRFARGRAIEAALGGNLPYGFRTIDSFRGTLATSIRSTAKLATQEAAIRGYIRAIARFSGDVRKGVQVTSAMAQQRRLLLAIPRGTLTQAEQAIVQNLTSYAQQRGVQFVIRVLS